MLFSPASELLQHAHSKSTTWTTCPDSGTIVWRKSSTVAMLHSISPVEECLSTFFAFPDFNFSTPLLNQRGDCDKRDNSEPIPPEGIICWSIASA